MGPYSTLVNHWYIGEVNILSGHGYFDNNINKRQVFFNQLQNCNKYIDFAISQWLYNFKTSKHMHTK